VSSIDRIEEARQKGGDAAARKEVKMKMRFDEPETGGEVGCWVFRSPLRIKKKKKESQFIVPCFRKQGWSSAVCKP
jgi:hypothetical protein